MRPWPTRPEAGDWIRSHRISCAQEESVIAASLPLAFHLQRRACLSVGVPLDNDMLLANNLVVSFATGDSSQVRDDACCELRRTDPHLLPRVRGVVQVRGYAAQNHVDNDLALFTVCGAYDTGGVVEGGFQHGGWFVPLNDGHVFAFDARTPHSMCGDACQDGATRWTTASFLSMNWTHEHSTRCQCTACLVNRK